MLVNSFYNYVGHKIKLTYGSEINKTSKNQCNNTHSYLL